MSGDRTRWGWHQLGSRWASRLVADAGIGPGDLVVDIGAGNGALTGPLLERGARVIAVELHQRRAADLRAALAGRRAIVVVADASDLRLPTQPFRVVANPPFALATAILKRLVAPGSRLERADIVVPWHTAQRWTTGGAPGERRWSREFTTRTGRPLPRSAFSPPPPSGIALLVVERRGRPLRPPVG
ncbi:MAG: rRNA adenine N-6-methyltransferase family protein [Acidimicrobiales bacterium]